MADGQILYVCFDPSLLLPRERLLMSMGFEVSTVLGVDGLVAVRDVDQFDCIVLGDEGSPAERQRAVRWLKEEFLTAPLVIALRRGHELVLGADYQVSTANGNAWLDAMIEYIRRRRKLA